MKNTCLILVSAAFAALAQTPQDAGIVYQQAGAMTVHSFEGRSVLAAPMVIGGDSVMGAPYSAVQQTHSLQVLGDGTRIERTETQQLYRDSMGRTRTESGPEGAGSVMIQDPVAGFNVILNPSTKTAQKIGMPPGAVRRLDQIRDAEKVRLKALVATQVTAAIGPGEPAGQVVLASGGAESGPASKPVVENLSAQNIDGVLATGHRSTLTIPAGQIGNDRPIMVTSETWYSSDLQMVVKSSNSDPRFGDSSLELTNIVRSEPDPSLFQIPADYTVSEPKAVVHSTPMAPRE